MLNTVCQYHYKISVSASHIQSVTDVLVTVFSPTGGLTGAKHYPNMVRVMWYVDLLPWSTTIRSCLVAADTLN